MPSIESDPYASHLPVLEALSGLIPMGRVLELGAGRYSTPFFLDHTKGLISLETDPKWATERDEHHRVRLVENCADSLPADLSVFDLVFIDNGGTDVEREQSIKAVLSQPHPPVVIHDAEVELYADAIKASGAHYEIFTWATPHTALVWR